MSLPTPNIPYKIRFAMYLVSAFGSLVVGYLSVKNYIGDPEVALWSGIAALVSGIAAINTGPVGDEKK